MKTYATDTGIKLLFPVVPKDSFNVKLSGTQAGQKALRWERPNVEGIFLFEPHIEFKNVEILGTCWRENGKLVCEGFDPEQLIEWIQVPKSDTHEAFSGYKNYLDEGLLYYSTTDSFESWARREGIEIAEGEFMNVVLKVN